MRSTPRESRRAADADDVDDGVDRADLVQLDVVGRDTVDGALGLGELGEDAVGARAHGVIQVAGARRSSTAPDRTVRVRAVLVRHDDGAGRGDPAPLGALERQRVAVEAEAVERAGDGLGVGAGVDQRAEQHVAGHARGAVDVGGASLVTGTSGPPRRPRRSRCRCRRR